MPKDQYKFLKDQMNVNDNNREDSVKVEDSEKEDVNYRYIDINTKIWLIIFLCMDWKKKICISQALIIQ